jgi:hypothetical protein
MMRNAMKALMLGLVVLSMAQMARAESLLVGDLNERLYYANVNLPTGTIQQGHLVNNNQPTTGGDFYNARMGSITTPSTFAIVNAMPALPFTYCVDLFHTLNTGVAGTAVHPHLDNDHGFYNPVTVKSTSAFTSGGNILDYSTLSLTNLKGIAQLVAHGVQAGTTSDDGYARGAALQAAIWMVEYNRPTALGWSATGNTQFQFNEFVDASHNIDTSNVLLTTTTTFNNALAIDMALVSGANFVTLNANQIASNVLFINPFTSNDPNDANPTTTGYAQALVSFDRNGNFNPTPVPGTLVMSCILFGMFGLVWSYNRVNSRKLAA